MPANPPRYRRPPMSAYAIKNLMEAENLATQEGREIRFTRKYLESAQLGVTYQHFGPDSPRPTATAMKSRRRPTS